MSPERTLRALLEAVVDLDLEHLEEASPKGYERFNEVFENRVQVTAWGAWRRDVRAALAGENSGLSLDRRPEQSCPST